MKRREQFHNLGSKALLREYRLREEKLRDMSGTLYPDILWDEMELLSELYEDLTGDPLETDL